MMLVRPPQPRPLAEKSAPDDAYVHLFRRCFLRPEAAAALLGYSTKHIIRLARDGELRGFNLAVATENPKAAMDERDPRSMIRIQKRSVEMTLRPEHFQGLDMAHLSLDDDLLHHRETFLIREITETFDCSDDHVRRLLGAGLLSGRALSLGSDRRHITRVSLLAFLTGRELTNL